jgi:hypothetical protein
MFSVKSEQNRENDESGGSGCLPIRRISTEARRSDKEFKIESEDGGNFIPNTNKPNKKINSKQGPQTKNSDTKISQPNQHNKSVKISGHGSQRSPYSQRSQGRQYRKDSQVSQFSQVSQDSQNMSLQSKRLQEKMKMKMGAEIVEYEERKFDLSNRNFDRQSEPSEEIEDFNLPDIVTQNRESLKMLAQNQGAQNVMTENREDNFSDVFSEDEFSEGLANALEIYDRIKRNPFHVISSTSSLESSYSSPSPGAPICQICYESSQVVSLSSNCQHKYCQQCINSYLEAEIRGVKNIQCPECSAKVERYDIERVNCNLLCDYEEMLVEKYLLSEPDCRRCPAPDCTFALIANSKCPKIICQHQNCKTKFCFKCREVLILLIFTCFYNSFLAY